MKIHPNNPLLLTYCTNIHPGNGWSEVFANIQYYAPLLKKRFAPHDVFGIGLRLSNQESIELLTGKNLEMFHTFLQNNGLFVFTINGFPYGEFHTSPVKDQAYAPDWQTKERVEYTQRLITILSTLLPKDVEGSISTVPLSYKPWVNQKDTTMWKKITRNIVTVVQNLLSIQKEQNKLIHLNLEPEPDCLLETSDEVIRFFNSWLLKEKTVAKEQIKNYVRICYDLCHMATQYENPEKVLEQFAAHGIKIGKLQISSALSIPFTKKKQMQKELQLFADTTYLHQVTQKNTDGSFIKYPDLPVALEQMNEHISEWRCHFHVPLFLKTLGIFRSTQEETKRVLQLLKKTLFTNHIEIETYTWDVLPKKYKINLLDSIAREYAWTLGELDLSS